MKQNAKKRAAVGAVVGSSVAQLADRIIKKNAFNNSTQQTMDVVSSDDPKFSEKIKDVRFKDAAKVPLSEGLDSSGNWKTKKSGFMFDSYKFKSPGKALEFGKLMSGSNAGVPILGALAGGGIGALGSVTIDSIHNKRIDRARKFVDQYKDLYIKTYGKKE